MRFVHTFVQKLIDTPVGLREVTTFIIPQKPSEGGVQHLALQQKKATTVYHNELEKILFLTNTIKLIKLLFHPLLCLSLEFCTMPWFGTSKDAEMAKLKKQLEEKDEALAEERKAHDEERKAHDEKRKALAEKLAEKEEALAEREEALATVQRKLDGIYLLLVFFFAVLCCDYVCGAQQALLAASNLPHHIHGHSNYPTRINPNSSVCFKVRQRPCSGSFLTD